MKALARFLVIGLMLAGAVSGIAASTIKQATPSVGIAPPTPLCDPGGDCSLSPR